MTVGRMGEDANVKRAENNAVNQMQKTGARASQNRRDFSLRGSATGTQHHLTRRSSYGDGPQAAMNFASDFARLSFAHRASPMVTLASCICFCVNAWRLEGSIWLLDVYAGLRQ